MKGSGSIDNHEFDLLRRALEDGMIDMETIEENVRMQEREKILEHHHRWQGKTTGLWYTYLPAPDKKNGRVQRERKTKEEIEDLIVDFYQKHGGVEGVVSPTGVAAVSSSETLESFFPIWLRYKEETGAAPCYIRKIYDHWKKYYIHDEIIKKDLKSLTCIELEVWAHQLVRKYNLTKTEYYNSTVIMRQALELAVRMHYLKESPFASVKMDAKHFRKVPKKDDATQVFSVPEQKALEKVCWEKYEKRPDCVSALSYPLFFRTGIRVGEMVALRKSDIQDDYIHIQREEVGDYLLEDINGAVELVANGGKIVEHTKTSAGDRLVYLTPEAKRIIERIIDSNTFYGNWEEDYLFSYKGRRMRAGSLIKKLYGLCDLAHIPEKSTHKIRKSYISSLCDAGVNINTIRKAVGHEDERTTYSAYVFDRRQKDEIEEQFVSVLDVSG